MYEAQCRLLAFCKPVSHSTKTALQKADGLKMEGYVLCDSKFNRVKVKSPNYVRLALLAGENADGANWKRILSIVQENEGTLALFFFAETLIILIPL
jgi:hypothetical protein